MTDTIDIVRRSQDRFAEILGNLPPDQVSAPSYDDEWSIADVASHLGSQAEIFGLFLDAGIDGTEPPNHDRGLFAVEMFGGTRDLDGLAAMRLSEHAVHTWDIAVALDPDATVSPEAVELLADALPATASRAAKTVTGATPVVVATHDPARTYRVTFQPDVSVHLVDGVAAADLTLPAEAFLRLVYGRLDPAHTPSSVSGDTARLTDLRKAFPGF